MFSFYLPIIAIRLLDFKKTLGVRRGKEVRICNLCLSKIGCHIYVNMATIPGMMKQ